mmetsp:Transcript_11986/g.30827  ORF Transcript_11986/g.30827 Transcript_11986/m.30827 type:complete len:271 (+) Transcript_11986:1052-1864(+)
MGAARCGLGEELCRPGQIPRGARQGSVMEGGLSVRRRPPQAWVLVRQAADRVQVGEDAAGAGRPPDVDRVPVRALVGAVGIHAGGAAGLHGVQGGEAPRLLKQAGAHVQRRRGQAWAVGRQTAAQVPQGSAHRGGGGPAGVVGADVWHQARQAANDGRPTRPGSGGRSRVRRESRPTQARSAQGRAGPPQRRRSADPQAEPGGELGLGWRREPPRAPHCDVGPARRSVRLQSASLALVRPHRRQHISSPCRPSSSAAAERPRQGPSLHYS